MIGSAYTGFALGASLILAIGAQNAFVLQHGLQRSHVFVICTICVISDVILIFAGVAGMGALVANNPTLEAWLRYVAAGFLFVYGAQKLRAAWRGDAVLRQKGGAVVPLRSAVLTCLALTWLNPHVYVDTVLMLGVVANDARSPIAFGIGASLASAVFFYALGFGARLLAPIFANPQSWRALDALMWLVMWFIAMRLVLG